MPSVVRRMQLADWTDSHGFSFSVEKSYAVLFRRIRRVFMEKSLTFYGRPLSMVRKVGFLGIIFDDRLTCSKSQVAVSCMSKSS